MIKFPWLKAFFIYFIGSALLTCPIFGHADTDGPGNGGIDRCTGQLTDQMRAKLAQPFYPKKEPLSGADFLHILSVAASASADFGQALNIAVNKHWRFDIPQDGFEKCHPENPYFASNPIYDKIACQKSSEIVVNPLYWYTVDADSCQPPKSDGDIRKIARNQIALDVHEALLGITLGTNLTDDDTIDVFRELTRPHMNANSLRKVLGTSALMPFVEQALKRNPIGTQTGDDSAELLNGSSGSDLVKVTPILFKGRTGQAISSEKLAAYKNAALSAISKMTKVNCGSGEPGDDIDYVAALSKAQSGAIDAEALDWRSGAPLLTFSSPSTTGQIDVQIYVDTRDTTYVEAVEAIEYSRNTDLLDPSKITMSQIHARKCVSLTGNEVVLSLRSK